MACKVECTRSYHLFGAARLSCPARPVQPKRPSCRESAHGCLISLGVYTAALSLWSAHGCIVSLECTRLYHLFWCRGCCRVDRVRRKHPGQPGARRRGRGSGALGFKPQGLGVWGYATLNPTSTAAATHSSLSRGLRSCHGPLTSGISPLQLPQMRIALQLHGGRARRLYARRGIFPTRLA